jgi:hypothetical protein
MLIIITKLKIGVIKYLILFNMLKHFQSTCALIKIIIVGKEIAEIVFKFFSRFVRKVKYIDIVGIKSASIQSRYFNNIRNSYVLNLPSLKKLNKGFFYFFLRLSATLVIFHIHKFVLLYSNICYQFDGRFFFYSNTCCLFDGCLTLLKTVYYICNKNTSVGLMKGDF